MNEAPVKMRDMTRDDLLGDLTAKIAARPHANVCAVMITPIGDEGKLETQLYVAARNSDVALSVHVLLKRLHKSLLEDAPSLSPAAILLRRAFPSAPSIWL